MSFKDPCRLLELLSKDKASVALFMNNIEGLATKKNHDYNNISDTEKEETRALLIAALEDPTDWLINSADLDVFVRSLVKYKATQNKEHLDQALELFNASFEKDFADSLNDLVIKCHHILLLDTDY